MTSISRRSFNFGAATLAIMSIGPRPSIAAAQSSPVRGGTLRISMSSEPPILVDIMQNTAGASVGAKVVEGLVNVNFDLSVSPHLAKSWTVSEDGKTYSFELQEGVRWHDGQPFTSEDVAFSYQTLREVHPRRRATFANLESTDTSDPHRLVLTFSTPVPFLLPALAAGSAPLIPKHLYEGTDIRSNPWNSKPIGTGPFVFKEWERGSHYLLERNPTYWIKGEPYLDEIIVRFIPDAASRVAALEANELDYVGGGQIPLDEVTRLSKDPRFGIEAKGNESGGALNQLFFNLRNEALAKLPVRQAIAHAIDIQDYIQKVYRGYAVPSPTAIVPSLAQFHDASIKPYAVDPALSEKLLDEAGYPRGTDGNRLRLRFTYNPVGGGGNQMRTAAEYLRSAFAKVGIDAELQTFDFATYVRRVYTDGAFDIDVQTLVNGYDPTDGIQRGYWSKNIRPGLAWSNHSNYSNPEVDEIFEKGAVEPDPAKRRDYYLRLQQILYRDLPAVDLVSYQSLAVYNKRLHDHTLVSDFVSFGFDKAWLEA